MKKKDNGSLTLKVNVRKKLMREIAPVAVLETHGGSGGIYRMLYSALPGVTMEKDKKKAAALAEQRPCWAVYNGDSEKLIAGGVGFHLPINFVDVDPYGSPWEVLDAVFRVAGKLPDRWGIAVNDGLRHSLKMKFGYKQEPVKPFVERFGNAGVEGRYGEICRALIEEKAGAVGLRIAWWHWNSGGYHENMSHYAAVLERV